MTQKLCIMNISSKFWVKNWPLVQNPHFLSYPHETLWKWLNYELIIFTKFHEDRTKNVDILLMANLLHLSTLAAFALRSFDLRVRFALFLISKHHLKIPGDKMQENWIILKMPPLHASALLCLQTSKNKKRRLV